MFSSKSLIVLALSFGCMIHLELIFVCHVSKGSPFVLLHVIQLFQYHVLKNYSFLIEWTWHPFQKSTDHKRKGLLLDSQFCSIVLSLSVWLTTLAWLLELCGRFWNWKVWVLQLCSSFSRLFCLFWLPCISTWLLELWHWILWRTSLQLFEECSQYVLLFLHHEIQMKNCPGKNATEEYGSFPMALHEEAHDVRLSQYWRSWVMSTRLRASSPDCPIAKWRFSLCK